jgi:hypothetical protein
MRSQQSTARTPSTAHRTHVAAALVRRFSVLSVRRQRIEVQRRQDRLAHLDLDQRVRETGEW